MKKIEHIAFAVKSLEHSIPLFEKLTGTTCYKTELVASEQVKTAFFMIGETKLELLESTGADSTISRFIEKEVKAFITLPLELTTWLQKWIG